MQSSEGNILYLYIFHKNNDPKTVKHFLNFFVSLHFSVIIMWSISDQSFN